MNSILHRLAARGLLALALAAGGGTMIAASPAMAQSKVSYSSDQVDRGEERYIDNCVDCHGEELSGGLLGGPPLKGLAFEEKYGNDGPAGVMFEVMSATMPPNSPGRFSPSQYADLMAYILKKNGYKAGAELPSDVEALYGLNMTK